MSEWNQGRSWYPNPNAYPWGEDPRSSYPTEQASYYPSQQYVGFNEFISQLQQNGSHAASNVTQQYAVPSYNNPVDTNVAPSLLHIPSSTYTQMPTHNPENNTLQSTSTDINLPPDDSRYFTSNLTPTATEFVPKYAQTQSAPPAQVQSSIPESSMYNARSGAILPREKFSNKRAAKSKPESNQNGSASGIASTVSMNGTGSQNDSVASDRESSRKENNKGNNSKNKKKTTAKAPTTKAPAVKAPTTEDVGRTFYNSTGARSSGSQDIRARNQDVRYSDSYSRDNNRDNNDRDSYRRDNTTRDSYGNNHVRETRDNLRRDGNTKDSNYNRDNGSRDVYNRDTRDVRENPIRDSRDARDNQSGDSRDNHRENKDNFGRDKCSRENVSRDSNSRDYYGRESARDNYSRDFYNRDSGRDSDSRDYQSRDSYNRESYGRNRHGSQRISRLERNADDDDQYANSYLTYREERQDGRRPVTSEKLQLVPGSPVRQKSLYKQRPSEKEENSELTQRERLSKQLDKGELECLVCCERVKQPDSVWSCGNCYHVLHLRCTRKWAKSSLLDGKWRCPACQNLSEEVPTDYLCFCGAMRAPEWVRGSAGAHGCGERCRRARLCSHPCPLPCHPGPCPACQATLNKKCGCGAETRAVVCSSKLEQVCGRACGKQLACGVHFCALSCHEGDCEPCAETLSQVCYCPADKSRVVECSAQTGGERAWACGDACGRVLACGAHVCRAACHPPPCQPCRLLPEVVLTCPCGKMKLTEKEKRESCSDPIPLCGNICAKPLSCGPPNDRHFCKLECHDGPCPPCPDKTVMNCRCAHTSRDVDCVDVPSMIDNIFCIKKCNKKLSCGRHRCRELCCALDTHRCPQVCGRTLSCGLHRCHNLCHTGHCPGCGRLGFSELRCECGEAVLLPPVACGARPPRCDAPCVRERSCGHPPHHSCHPGECPPCVVLTSKRCHGSHEERKTIPCHQEEFSCGLPCGKPLPCGKHTCNKLCHKGECATAKCVQQCMEKRPGCGHPCGARCHAAADAPTQCPSPAPCRHVVRATCACGRRATDKPCADNAKDFAKAMSTMVASKMQDGSSVDLSDVTRPGANLKTLECDDECRVEARTRQMALVLQIRNPDTSSKLAPRYSELVRQWAARDPAFASLVHDKLTQLVQLAKKSKQKTRSHSFPSMNHQKRQFVHELCEHFGCESVAYDAEPNRNVVATADREKSWLPAMSVLEVLEREAGKRRVPGPMLRPATSAGASASAAASSSHPHGNKSGGWATLTSKNSNAWGARPSSSAPAAAAPSAPPPAAAPPPARRPPPIDYFDDPPTN